MVTLFWAVTYLLATELRCAELTYLKQLLLSWTQPLGQDAVGRSYIDGSNPASSKNLLRGRAET